MEQSGRFNTLEEQECLELLRTNHVGRVAWQSSQGLTILPVTFAVHAGLIVFRTAREALLAELAHSHPVAFEVDDTDETTATGWSVLVRGRSGSAADADELTELWQSPTRPEPWAEGQREVMVTIRITHLSGRIVSRAD